MAFTINYTQQNSDIVQPPLSQLIAQLNAPTFSGTVTTTGAVNLNGTPNNIKGVIDGSNAPAGYVGEVLTASGGPFSLASNTAGNIVALSLTPGDWDVRGALYLPTQSGLMQAFVGCINNVSATINSTNQAGLANSAGNINAGSSFALPIVRYNFTVTTAIFAVCLILFSTGANTVQGWLTARRMR